jgi:hypothetical protein
VGGASERGYVGAGSIAMKRKDLGALHAAAEGIIKLERRALNGADIFDRLSDHMKSKTTRGKICRDLANTSLARSPDRKWTIDPKSLWKVPPGAKPASARGKRIKLLKDCADRAFAMVDQEGPCRMRSLHAAIAPDIEFASFKKALVNRICATSQWGRNDETVFLRRPVNSSE